MKQKKEKEKQEQLENQLKQKNEKGEIINKLGDSDIITQIPQEKNEIDIDKSMENYDSSKYKIYYHDTGLLIANLDEESSDDLRKNQNLGTYKGAIYENLIGQMLTAQGQELFYYKKENSQLEMDFFVRTSESLVPLEVKSKDGATASLNNLISYPSYSDVRFGIKLAHKNIGFNGKFYTIPYFCAFLIKRFLKEDFVIATNKGK